MKAKNAFFLAIGIILLVVSFVATGILYFKLKKVSETRPIVTEEKTDKPFDGVIDLTKKELKVNWGGKATPIPVEESNKWIDELFPKYSEIKRKIKTIQEECKTKPEDGQTCDNPYDPNIYFFKVGEIIDFGNLPLYYIFVPNLYPDGPANDTENFLGFYVASEKKWIRIAPQGTEENAYNFYGKYEISAGYGEQGDMTYVVTPDTFKNLGGFSLFSGYIMMDFPEIIPPNFIFSPDGGKKLKKIDFLSRDSRFNASKKVDYYGDSGINELATGSVITDYYRSFPVAFNDSKLGPIYFNDGCYHVILQNGSVVNYELVPYFLEIVEDGAEKELIPNGYQAKIKWENKKNDSDLYIVGTVRPSCGGGLTNCFDVVHDTIQFKKENLTEIGRTIEKNEPIFALKDAVDNDWYKNMSMSTSASESADEDVEESKRIETFVKDNPLFFWKDKDDVWRVYQKAKYVPLAECGKPVIYLYPEKDTDVKVEVKPNGGFTKTEPMYDNGWFVHATPQSELFNYTDKTSYPYLFWEGKAYNFITPNYGFVMSKKDVSTKMTQILTKLGLNEKETIDFLEFWQPKLEVKPYVFVTFLPQREFDKLAPLTVNPKPDTIIRVFMDYTPLDAPVKVAPMQIRTPERVGFTVVEWGGKLN